MVILFSWLDSKNVMTSNKIIMGPADNKRLPCKSLGIIFYNELKKKNPNKIILIDGETEDQITYGKFFELSVILANKLKELGVKKGDVITMVAQNSWKYLVTIISGFYVGAQVNLLNPDYTPGELKRFLSICQPILIFSSQKSLENIFKLQDELWYPQSIVVFDGDGDDKAEMKTFDGLFRNGEFNSKFIPIELNPEENGALILTSSGTSGFPKCVPLTHANFRLFVLYFGDSNFIDSDEKETTIAYLPFFHVFGCAIGIGSILFGTKAIILQKFIPDQFLKVIDHYKVSKLYTVPPILIFLVKSPLVDNYDISSIKDILCGAANATKELEDLVQKRLKIKSVRQMYGLTETTGPVIILPKDVQKIGSVGKVTNTHQLKVCDVNNGEALTSNQIGELRIKGGGVMKGYLGNIEESKTIFDEDGFLKSGDLGYYDDEGFFYIVGRLKDIIKYKGYQVSPVELENLLIQHPAIKDAGVIGKPDERAGEVPVAFVVKQPNKDLSEEEIIRFVAENLSIQKHLYGGVRFLDEIPKNASGKILRRKLKELL